MARAFNAAEFRTQVSTAMTTVKRLLSNARAPELPREVSHTYNDKYALAEQLTNTAAAALANTLEAVGVTGAMMTQLKQWSEAGHEVTVRFSAREKIEFVCESTRDIESPKVTTTTTKEGYFGSTTKSKSTQVVTTVTEYNWKYTVEYQLVGFKGASPDESSVRPVVGGGSYDIVTKVKQAPSTVTGRGGPNAATNVFSPLPQVSVSLTWLLKMLSKDLELGFSIDRTSDKCRTPRRNPEIEQMLSNVQELARWSLSVQSQIGQFQSCGGKQSTGHVELFVPVIPLFEKNDSPPAYNTPAAEKQTVHIAKLHAESSSVVLQLDDVGAFLTEHRRALGEMKAAANTKHGASGGGLHSGTEAALRSVLVHIDRIASQYSNGIGSIESMLEEQLCAAIGRDINPESFHQFMKHHNSKLYTVEHAPQQFCYAVRRPNCYPEGSVSIEAPKMGDVPAEPVSTIVRHIATAPAMQIRLSASCSVELQGDRYLHTYLAQSFRGNEMKNFSLVARARQFSSFILMVGKLDSATSFQPKHAIIIKDKDDLTIPLLLETLPSAKEFEDAIESLSPEQQRFAKAYRAMQLEGTVFAVGFIQLKPQLERLLNLPAGSLIKEIQLSQDLQELFIDHQIPSDLLSYDGDPDASRDAKLDAVRDHVKAIMDMVKAAKEAEIEEAKMVYQASHPEALTIADSESDCSEDEEDDWGCRDNNSYNSASNSFSYAASASACCVSAASVPKRKGFGVSLSRLSWKSKGLANSDKATPSKAIASMPKPALSSKKSGTAKAPAAKSLVIEELSLQSSLVSEDSIAGIISDQKEQGDTDTSMDIEPQGQSSELAAGGSGTAVDFTQFPALLDQRFLALDTDSALRPTKINVGDTWQLQHRAGLLAKPTTDTMNQASQRSAKDKAFDLLDAISRSGALPITDCASLHIVVAVTHQFDKDLIDTVVQDNFNPIEKVERSSLIIAGAVHDKPIEMLVRPQQLYRISDTGHCGMLLAPEHSSGSTV